ncbi:MAG: sigma-70 family RNA polymerase sigma factor [Clostridia bacterium]|nr:sigma-70 family RNA polymerase sigma factor [Clostridia bacterium]
MGIYELLERIQKGDKEAVVDIFLRFNGTIKKLSKKLRYEESETDLIIAFLEIIKKMDVRKFQMKSDGAIVNYIYCCLTNEYADLYKKKKAFENVYFVEMELDTIADNISEDVDSKLFVSMLINSLPPLQKKVIVKKFIEDFSDKEIAICLGVSRQAVNRAKNRGLNNLKRALE